MTIEEYQFIEALAKRVSKDSKSGAVRYCILEVMKRMEQPAEFSTKYKRAIP